MLRNFIEYFRHHRAERNGALAMLVIMVVIIVATHVFTLVYNPPVKDISPFIALIDSLERLNDSASANEDLENKPFELFVFEPNLIQDDDYLRLGFSEKEIKTLRNYQNSGAVFRTKSDFKKLYFLDDDRYETLYPYIDLPDSLPKKSKQEKFFDTHPAKTVSVKWSDTTSTESYYTYNPIVCDLNLADTNELKKLPYIGSYYARQIVKLRQELGGFHTVAQLLEIYKMTPETIDKIADRITIDTSQIVKINVNAATAQELAAHPYISFKLANAMVQARETSGNFEDMENLCNSNLLNAELCVKLAPYLSFR